MEPRPKVEVTIFGSFDFSASIVYPRMQHIVAITNENTKIVPIALRESTNERIINIIITVTIRERLDSLFIGSVSSPCCEFDCRFRAFIFYENAFCDHVLHILSLPLLVDTFLLLFSFPWEWRTSP
jgi:hypothetical protein